LGRLCITALTLVALTAGCSDGATSDGACESQDPNCVDDVSVPAEPSD
jgi:hypothetical protein